jgi:hypothetical protein
MNAPSKLPIPFWAVTPRHLESPPPHEPCNEPLHTLAFSEIDRFVRFLESRDSGEWKICHVMSDMDLVMLVADLHRQKVRAICLNPDADGSSGTSIELSELLGQVDTEKSRLANS